MCKYIFILLLFPLIMTSCGQDGTEQTYSTNPGEDKSIAIEYSPDTAQTIGYVFPDTLVLQMNSKGKIGWLDRQIPLQEVQKQLQDSLLSLYVHTGKLPSKLDLTYQGNVTRSIRGAAHDQINQAKLVLINALALKEQNQVFNRLDSLNLEKFIKEYPVLFQKSN